MNYIGKNLRYIRDKFAITQSGLAFETNIKQTTLSNWENEVSSPNAVDLVKLYQYLGISLDFLLMVDMERNNLLTETDIKKFRERRHQPLKISYAAEPESMYLSKNNTPAERGGVALEMVLQQIKALQENMAAVQAIAERIEKKLPQKK